MNADVETHILRFLAPRLWYCSLVGGLQHFGGPFFLHFQGFRHKLVYQVRKREWLKIFIWSRYIECCSPSVKSLFMVWWVLEHIIECVIFVQYEHSLWYCNTLAVHKKCRGSERIGGIDMYIAFLQGHTWNQGTIKIEQGASICKVSDLCLEGAQFEISWDTLDWYFCDFPDCVVDFMLLYVTSTSSYHNNKIVAMKHKFKCTHILFGVFCSWFVWIFLVMAYTV